MFDDCGLGFTGFLVECVFVLLALLIARPNVDEVASGDDEEDVPDPRGEALEELPYSRTDRCECHGAGVISAIRLGVSIGPSAFFSP